MRPRLTARANTVTSCRGRKGAKPEYESSRMDSPLHKTRNMVVIMGATTLHSGRSRLTIFGFFCLTSLSLTGCFGGSDNNSGTAAVDEEEQAAFEIFFTTRFEPTGPLSGGALYKLDTDSPDDLFLIAAAATDQERVIEYFTLLPSRDAVLYSEVDAEFGVDGPVMLVSMTDPGNPTAVAPGDLNYFPEQISFDGRWLAERSAGRTRLLLIDLDAPGQALEITNPLGTGEFGTLAFSADSSQLFFTVNGRIYVIGLETPASPSLLYDPGVASRVGRLLPSDDGQFFVLAATYDRQLEPNPVIVAYDLFSLDLSSGMIQKLGGELADDRFVLGDYRPIVWYPDERNEVFYLVARFDTDPVPGQIYAPSEVRRVKLDSPEQSRLVSDDLYGDVYATVFVRSFYSNHLAYMVNTGSWMLVDLDALETLPVDDPVVGERLHDTWGIPYFLPDGQSLLMGNLSIPLDVGKPRGLFLVDLARPAEGMSLTQPLAPDEVVFDYRLMSDGETVFYTTCPLPPDESIGLCGRGGWTGLFSVNVHEPGAVTRWLDADSAADVMRFQVLIK